MVIENNSASRLVHSLPWITSRNHTSAPENEHGSSRLCAECELHAHSARLRVLADASRAFAAAGSDYHAVLALIARTTAEAFGGLCGIRMLSNDRVWLTTVALHDAHASGDALAALTTAPLPAGLPVFQRMLQSERAERVPALDPAPIRTATRPDEWPALDHSNDYRRIVAPLRANGRVIGMLAVTRHVHVLPAFTDDDLILAQDLADRAALVIENARLFHQLQAELAERTKAEAAVRSLGIELEQRVAERTAELTAANKELEAFSYSISHDLRAPLRAIDGFARILADDFLSELPDEAQRYLQLVRGSAQQMSHLIDDLLTFSRLSRQPLHTRSFNPTALVRQCLEELQDEQAGRDVQIDIGALPDCQADPALLKQVWINLIANALKYTRRRAPVQIMIGCQIEGAMPVYFIRDNGVGFDMRYSDKLFGVFQRLHRAEEYEGTGVGLAIVERIIHRHGGSIWAFAEIDNGATFYFTMCAN